MATCLILAFNPAILLLGDGDPLGDLSLLVSGPEDCESVTSTLESPGSFGFRWHMPCTQNVIASENFKVVHNVRGAFSGSGLARRILGRPDPAILYLTLPPLLCSAWRTYKPESTLHWIGFTSCREVHCSCSSPPHFSQSDLSHHHDDSLHTRRHCLCTC